MLTHRLCALYITQTHLLRVYILFQGVSLILKYVALTPKICWFGAPALNNGRRKDDKTKRHCGYVICVCGKDYRLFGELLGRAIFHRIKRI